ncbi:unnamed protein product, partial [Sphacelaria rigidula]
ILPASPPEVIQSEIWDLGFFLTSCPPDDGERPYRGYTRIDFTIDKGKGPLNSSCDEKKGGHSIESIYLKHRFLPENEVIRLCLLGTTSCCFTLRENSSVLFSSFVRPV